eukprot:2449353-Pyramimonas_sp.AAC.1
MTWAQTGVAPHSQSSRRRRAWPRRRRPSVRGQPWCRRAAVVRPGILRQAGQLLPRAAHAP